MISEPLRIRVWGPWACFTRPEFHVERVSYPVMTPSAARGVLEAILMKPIEKPEADKRDRKIGFRWHVLRIGIVKKGFLVPILRNELGYEKHTFEGFDILEERTQRHSLLLREVEYLIEAVIEVPEPVRRIGEPFLIAKYQGMFERRAHSGQCYHRPYLGCREFPAEFSWEPEAEPMDPDGNLVNENFGTMFRDFDFDPVWELWPSGKPRPLNWEKDGAKVTPKPKRGFQAHARNGWIPVAEVHEQSGRKAVVDL
jgi:CRISPR-associated protein Cas5d